ncbi:MAG TPA: ABC transporter ATP-binding protein [Streptosporangiaceae bacterium]|nr:ABC transporter ATP-binding protein [Streptosporangiaceae bacterium]
MLVAVTVGVGVCVVSLAAGLAARTRLARSPVAGTAPAQVAVADRWAPLARALLRSDRRVAGLAVWLMLLDALLALAAPWPLMLVVDYGLGHHPCPPWLAGLAGLPPVRLAAVAAAAGLLVLAMGSVAGYLVTFLTGALGERMSARLRATLVGHLLYATPRAVSQYPLGELTSRVGTDAVRVADTVTVIMDTLIPDSAVLAGMTVLTALLDWRLTLVVLGVIPLYALTARLRNRALRPAQQRARARSGELAAFATDLLARIPAVHVFDRAGAETQRYHGASTEAAAAAVTALDASARFAPATDTLPGLGLAAALVAGTIEVASGRLTVGGLLVFLAYLSSLTTPVRSLARLSTAVARGRASRDRIAELLRLPVLQPAAPSPALTAPAGRGPSGRGPAPGPAATPATSPEAGVPVRPPGRRRGPAITMRQVSYAHRAGHAVLASASLDVPGGAFVCVTGPSGSGKSTLLSLLVRLVDPHSGSITIDGRDISHIPLRVLRELVTLVPQDPWLHTGSIADNIGYGRPGAHPSQILAAAERAGVAAFASALPGGLDTEVGEHGRQLSGGQQRRVAVARALLRDTPVLLLDEPTTGLDPATEARLIGELLAVAAGKTVVLVTHQPQLTARADQVVRVDDGAILTPALARSA